MNKPEISILIPVLNEEESIELQNRKIKEALGGKLEYEVIWIDDGSDDNTGNILEKIAKEDESVKAFTLMRRVGQSGAIMAGLDNASGEYIATMDGDNQNDPDEFIKMFKKLKEEKLDAVVGWRVDRWKGNIIRRLPSLMANMLLRWSFKAVDIHDTGCPVKIVRADVMRNVRLYGELHRFISYIIYMQGAKIGELPIGHREREAGKSKYGIGRAFTVIFDILNVKFLTMRKRTPIQLMGPIAAVLYIFSFVIVIYLLYEKFFGLGLDVSGSPYFILSIMSAILATQFVVFGLLGELIIRSYYENGTEKKTYMIRREY
jgi:glycosyltransferase involved in cell wall biosynthesis